jgi:ethanolamine utilization protein EutN
MKLGKVIGTVVPCEVTPGLEAVPMRWVQPLTKDLKPKGAAIVCADSTRMAADNELIYFEGGREAAMTLDPAFVPVDHAIVGLVDEVALSNGDA